MFKITQNKGFHMTFANGYAVSVQWGRGNYCENQHCGVVWGEPVPACEDAEVAAFDPNGAFMHLSNGDDVMGRMSADEVLAFMNAVAAIQEGEVLTSMPMLTHKETDDD